LALITPVFQRQPAQQKTTIIDESRDVFTKQLLGENLISGIMCENPGREGMFPFAPSDAHDDIWHIKTMEASD